MSEKIITPSKAWLSAKDNWLGEGAFRPASAQREPAPPQPAQTQRQAPPPAYAEVYFAHG